MVQSLNNPNGQPLLTIASVTGEPIEIEPLPNGERWKGVQEIAFELGDLHWYGMGGLGNQHYPLEKIALYPSNYVTSDNGATGLLTILAPFWWTSNGVGILVEGDEFAVSFNRPLEGEAHQHSFTQPAPLNERPLLAEGRTTDGRLTLRGHQLSVRFFLLENPRQVIEAYWELLEIPEPPPEHLFRKVLWTTWANFKNDISHEKIFEFAEKISDYNFNCGHLGIDAKWQDEFGSTRFDPAKFPNPKGMIAGLHRLGFQVTLWCVPFFHPQSQHYQTAIDRGYVLKNDDGTPLILDWWEGQAAALNVTNPDALTWHLDNLQRLADEVELDSFKFDAGEGMFYAHRNIRLEVPPNRANHLYIEQIAKRFPWSDVRSGWNNQAAPMLFRQWDKSSWWGYDNGLASCITQAITLSMLGYPFHFADMVGGNKYSQQQPTAELLIRWTQAVAAMPIVQFSLAPWDYGEECAQLCARYARLHGELSPRVIALAEQGQPIIRPLWWLDPNDTVALACADQYLVGDDLLVAPVIHEGARTRDIYLPAGQWRSYWQHEEVHQAGWLHDYPAPLERLPLFEKIG
jgi:alpha-glucosidase (family GH31 glycosyl hydrolase)